jgi:TRAP-type C4-dicarboxylate transport system permease small subunit
VSDTEPTPVIDTEPVSETEPMTDAAPRRPRIRWGALAWGLILVVTALATLTVAGDATARADIVDWWTGLGVAGGIVVAVLAVGGFILLQGVLALLRRAQRPRS